MPPKKIVDAPRAGTGDEAALAKEQKVVDGINIEDYALPKSIVTRLAKGALPPNTQIAGNAMLAMTKSATVFVNYLAAHANEHAQSQGRKTLGTADVFAALEQLEFPEWKERLESELAKYQENQSDKRNKAKKTAAEKAAETNDDSQIADGQPAAKKAKLDEQVVEGPDESLMERTADGVDQEGGSPDDDQGDDEEDDEDDDIDEEAEERKEAEEQLEDTQGMDVEDEALDNGEDSD